MYSCKSVAAVQFNRLHCYLNWFTYVHHYVRLCAHTTVSIPSVHYIMCAPTTPGAQDYTTEYICTDTSESLNMWWRHWGMWEWYSGRLQQTLHLCPPDAHAPCILLGVVHCPRHCHHHVSGQHMEVTQHTHTHTVLHQNIPTQSREQWMEKHHSIVAD